MAGLFERYRDYRQVGFGPVIAMRFAWLVGRTGGVPVRSLARR